MKLLTLTILLSGTMLAAACGESKPQVIAEYRKISAEDAFQMMHDNKEYVLLDVRTVEEFNEVHIKGALLIPDSEISSRAADELPDKSVLILVYCRSGRRSESAARELVDMGYTNVNDFGGILDWPFETKSSRPN